MISNLRLEAAIEIELHKANTQEWQYVTKLVLRYRISLKIASFIFTLTGKIILKLSHIIR